MDNVNQVSSSSIPNYFQRAEEISKIESPTPENIRELFECYKNNPSVVSLFFG